MMAVLQALQDEKERAEEKAAELETLPATSSWATRQAGALRGGDLLDLRPAAAGVGFVRA